MMWELTKDYRLRWMDFDRYGRIHPAVVLDIFQDIATLQANDVGIGHDEMLEKGVFWAVARMKYEVLREPVQGSVVSASTWPHSPSHFSFMRDYLMADEDGAALIKATSEWVLIDAENRELASVKDAIDLTDFETLEKRAFAKKPRKIKTFPIEGSPRRIVVPAYSDIDLNGHMNNARYAYFAVDTMGDEGDRAIRSFQIDYRVEALEGEELRLYERDDEDTVTIVGMNPEGKISFTCAMEVR